MKRNQVAIALLPLLGLLGLSWLPIAAKDLGDTSDFEQTQDFDADQEFNDDQELDDDQEDQQSPDSNRTPPPGQPQEYEPEQSADPPSDFDEPRTLEQPRDEETQTTEDFQDFDPDRAANSKGEEEVQEAIAVLEKIMSDPDTRIPSDLLAQSQGIAIIPGVVQAGFILGGRRGTGIMMLRHPDGTWSNPAFVKLTGGSLGLQIGAKSSDLVLVFPSRSTVNEVLSSSFKLGGSVSGVAGPVEGTAVDPTDRYSDGQIYTYTRTRGLFGGVNLDGSKLGLIKKTNRDFYGRQVTARRIFTDTELSAPRIVKPLRQMLRESEQGNYSRY